MKKKSQKSRNFVAKHAQTAGAGVHIAKTGKLARRSRQKQSFRKYLKDLARE